MRFRSKNIVFWAVFGFLFATPARSQNHPGNWYMYFGQYRISQKLGLHTDIQNRKYDLVRDPQQLLLRWGVRYYCNTQFSLVIGHARIYNFRENEPYFSPAISFEDRIWQEAFFKHRYKRLYMFHRVRLEQRFLHDYVNTEFRQRLRYFFRLNVILNEPEMVKGALFAGVYNEYFLNIFETGFDRNRAYIALGYRFNSMADFQLGFMLQTVGKISLPYAQVMLNWDVDFRKN